MKNSTILALSILIWLTSCSNKTIAPLIQEGTHFKRTNLLVANLEKSLTIYRDILDFKIHKISPSSKESFSYPVFNIPKEANLKSCTLDSPDQIRTIALTEVTGIQLPSPPSQPHLSASVIRVRDLPMVMEKIKALGLSTTNSKIAQGSDGGMFVEQAFVDFDGHLIVLYEYK